MIPPRHGPTPHALLRPRSTHAASPPPRLRGAHARARVRNRTLTLAVAVALLQLAPGFTPPNAAAQAPAGRPTLVLTNAHLRAAIDPAGGSIAELRPPGHPVNPLAWNTPAPGESGPRGYGHFLCLDRWGPPSEPEGKRGMPYHGEAAHAVWTPAPTGSESPAPAQLHLRLTAHLPIAGLALRRDLHLAANAPVVRVDEWVTNTAPLGRPYNAVQHPTIAPPFLDHATLVDCNGTGGFAQGPPESTPRKPAFHWPSATQRGHSPVDLRRLTDNPEPNVTTFAIPGRDTHGWVTATSPTTGLLLGYVWRTSDYPWVSHWRDVRDGKPAARGLEFGSTGIHQPFRHLLRQGSLWNRPVFEYLEPGESARRSYLAFVIPIPADFAGVRTLTPSAGKLVLQENRRRNPRTLEVPLDDLSLP